MGYKWTCPYCNHPCTVGDEDVRRMTSSNFISKKYGCYSSEVTIVVCPNPECLQQSISLTICTYEPSMQRIGDVLFQWKLVPESEAKPFPDYILESLRKDYQEACLIKDRSPKASATLSRRCLQGMIRDFWGIRKDGLSEEIKELESRVDAMTWKAIDSVREIGNIGAHMQKDVNLIIDVDPEEASLLIWLIETLFQDWYIARHERETRMKNLVKIAEDKKAQKASPRQTDPADKQ